MLTDPNGRPVSSGSATKPVSVTVEQAAAIYGQLVGVQTAHVIRANVPAELLLWQVAQVAASVLGAVPNPAKRSELFAGFTQTLQVMLASRPVQPAAMSSPVSDTELDALVREVTGS